MEKKKNQKKEQNFLIEVIQEEEKEIFQIKIGNKWKVWYQREKRGEMLYVPMLKRSTVFPKIWRELAFDLLCKNHFLDEKGIQSGLYFFSLETKNLIPADLIKIEESKNFWKVFVTVKSQGLEKLPFFRVRKSNLSIYPLLDMSDNVLMAYRYSLLKDLFNNLVKENKEIIGFYSFNPVSGELVQY